MNRNNITRSMQKQNTAVNPEACLGDKLDTKVKCPNSQEIQLCCIQTKCYRRSLHCPNKDCETCQALHPFCRTIPLSKLHDFYQKHRARQSPMLDLLHKHEAELIDSIRSAYQQIYNKMEWGLTGLPRQISEPLSKIFIEKSMDKISGMDIEELQQEIGVFKPIDKSADIQEMHQRGMKLVQDCLKQQQKILLQVEGTSEIYSKIVTSKQDVSYIFQALDNPSRLQLLYRASENAYSAAKFHEKCDDIPNTLTLVRTQFGKVIGAFTPLEWSAPSQWVSFPDKKKQSFLLQVNRRVKIPIQDPLYGIYCLQTHGPRFGRGDLLIPNNCQHNSCKANFPSSYNLADRMENSQESYRFLSGASSGCEFRATDYEVFKVVF